MKVPGSDNAGLVTDIFGPEFLSERKETLKRKRKQTAQCWVLTLFCQKFSFLSVHFFFIRTKFIKNVQVRIAT